MKALRKKGERGTHQQFENRKFSPLVPPGTHTALETKRKMVREMKQALIRREREGRAP